jgi:hypothetical protein
MNIDLKKNLTKIIQTLEGQGMKTTKIAQAIGYTTTRQLYNTVDGKSLLSTKAVMGLIENLNVNPSYVFLGKGEMFITDESEIETLRKENREWIQRHNEVVKTVMSFYEIIKKLEKRNADLIDLSSAALKYSQEQKQEAKDEKDLKDPESENLNFLKWLAGERKEKLFDISDLKDPILGNIKFLPWLKDLEKGSNKEEPNSSTKQDKK